MTVGRTPWDFAAEAIRSRTALFIVAAVFLVLPLTIHFLAEPMSEISLFGLIKYKKAAQPPEPPKAATAPEPPAAVPPSYSLPDKVKIRHEAVVPILDGTLNIAAVFIEDQRVACRLGGANLAKTRIRARQLNGNPAVLAPSGAGGPVEVTLTDGCVFEVAYLKHTFQIMVHDVGYPEFELSVKSVPNASLDLLPPPLK